MFFRGLSIALLLLAVYVGISFFQLRSELFKVYDAPPEAVIAAQDADLTIVEFVLYSCEACRSIFGPFQAAMRKDGKIRYIPRPVAYEDENPGQSERVYLTYAAAKQGKFEQTFNYFMTNDVTLDQRGYEDLAGELGLDLVRLKTDMESEDVKKSLAENEKFFEEWRLQSAPAFLMGEKAIFRIRSTDEIPTEEEFIGMFEKARSFF
ncbi:MAG: thioredoxin domain-containing protein [Alphaproteobacteria bacterium]|nr:thioredoxin domain-containing protein [Alphaproteobacteria bacterium]MBP7759085.1 thioredoxin domain-containing protein [Alphaproteobacteria bacterium]MBP7762449.1 thioredoxin domain-containing protein [Alphaproteobacteria bacterium]MBP7904518.1 thioredoxin domain-containing protein [Alphaproteobacteria bacterium]